MANTKVEIRVAVKADAKDVYLVGSTTSLGAWDAKKAVKLEYCEKCGKFTTSKMLPAGETVEFKVLAGKTWDAVEKGDTGYELENHSFIAAKGLVVEVEVVNFAK
ncbi:MAG: hypothetical protein MR357_02420 [Anaeroplasma sp.]|nr:hypothetical protein [Anaeroplasma sp.]